jgi:hypothetical protein
VALVDRGFGSPTTIPQAGDHAQDRGFGSPTTWAPATSYGQGDAGFGSPYSPLAALPPIIFPPPPATFGDEGGYVYSVSGTWPIRGPYTVRFIDELAAPHPAVGGAYSAIPGERDDCQTNPFQDLLTFTIPPLNPGLYDLQITWDPGGELILEDVIKIIRRNRDAETYRLRRGYQSLFRVGPGLVEGEPELGDVDDEFPRVRGHRQVRTHVVGKALQQLGGVPATRVNRTFSAGELSLAVETTLAFPDKGRVWCLGSLFRYNGKTDTALLNFEPMPFQDFPWGFSSLHVNAEVTLDVASYLPT